jgi:hypothetical protein
MTNKLVTLTALAALSLAPAVAFAQSASPSAQQPSPGAQQPETSNEQTMPNATTNPASPQAPASEMPASPTVTAATPKFVSAQASGQWMASDLIGEDVVTSSDEKLGTISDAVLDADGNVLASVIDVGGFLGIGAKPVAVSFDSLTVTPSEDGFKIVAALTREELNTAPEFKTLEDARDDAAAAAPKTN